MSLPQHIGPYAVERLLGAGAMGSVFLARDPRTQAPLAIKVQHQLDPELTARFAREAAVMGRINDPRVVRALDAGLHEGEPYLVLEYCPGEDLAERLKREGALEPREAVRLVAEIGRGLAAAHAQGVLHRDLKPANVLLDSAGRPKVADFGLARVDKKPGAQSLTQSGVIMGTPAYMAPEQADDARQVDARSDVYALGVILYECLSGKRPFGTGGTFAILERVCAGKSEPLPPELPPELVEVVTCAMALDPADRFSEVSGFVTALEEALAAPTRGRSGGWVPLASGAVLLGVLGLGVAWGLSAGAGGGSNTPPATPLGTGRPVATSPISPVATSAPEVKPSATPRAEIPTPETPEFFRARAEFWRASLSELRAAAAAGHPAAQTRLGAALLRARGVPRDTSRALELLEAAGRAGDTEAMLILVSHYQGAPQSEDWLARALRAKSPHAQLSRALLTKDLEGIESAGRASRERLAAGDPAAFYPVAIYANFSGDFEAAAEAVARGCDLGVPAAFSFRARLARARGGERSQEVYEDFRYAAERHDAEGLCGQARWLLDQEEPSRAERELAERLLKEAEESGYRGAQVERVLKLRRAGKESAWADRVRALGRESTSSLTSACWGELGVHLNEVFQSTSGAVRKDLRALSIEFIRRARPPRSLDPRVTYYRALYLYRGSPKVRTQALRLFRRAAEAGHPRACHAWGVALLHGQGVKQDVRGGVEALERAARGGFVLSWRWLGDLYAKGEVVERDLEKATGYYLLAAQAPDAAPSLFGSLATAYLLLERYEESRAWGERAAAAKDPVGSGCLGSLLLQGLGGAREPERGIRLLRSLVERPRFEPPELPTAIKSASLLAEVYEQGVDAPRDPELAKRYRDRASSLSRRLASLRGSGR